MDRMASSRTRDLSQVPAPSSTSTSAPEVSAISLANVSRIQRSQRVG